MKIGFVVSFFDFRNDVRRVMAEVATQHQIVIFGHAEHEAKIRSHAPEGAEFRVIDEAKKSRWNNTWERAYLLFKRIPRSENNFYLMELFKVSNQPDARVRAKGRRLLRLIKLLPKVLPYDFFLNRLRFKSETQINDIDQFICFTAIADDYFLARLLRQKTKVKVYVYSWDHPCKHICFSKRVQYLCWSEGIKADIVDLQKIPPHRIDVVGASQFGYVYDFLQLDPAQLTRSYPFEYIYFGCAIGITDLVLDEINVIKSFARVLSEVQPTWKLVVRAYPVLSKWEYYEELRELPNVVLDDGFRTKDLSVKDDNILEKFEKIHFANGFFHLGTTMGLEACFTDTPSFIVDYGSRSYTGLSLHSFIHQHQNDLHLRDLAPHNVVADEYCLENILRQIDDPDFVTLNTAVKERYPLKSFKEFANDLIDG